jgi:hypothetical protein
MNIHIPLLSDLLRSVPRRVLVMYWRHRRTKEPRGCVVAIKDGDIIRFGWSWCCKKDRPNKKTAVAIAYERAFARTGVGLGWGADNYDNAKIPRALIPLSAEITAIAERVWHKGGRG